MAPGNRVSVYRLAGVLSILILLCGCQVGRSIYYNFAGIGDYKIFPERQLKSAEKKFTFHTAEKERIPRTINPDQKGDVPFTEFLEKSKTVAFLVIRNDTILCERYYGQYDKESIVPSFSIAKSVTSLLIGCAINDGLIQSVEDPVTKYIPELKRNGFDKVTLKHALQMTSGLNFSESYYNPFSDAANFYYGRNLEKEVCNMKLKKDPGTSFEYTSGNTQLLGLVLSRSLKGKNVTGYLQEKIWTPLGMEYEGSWSVDHADGIEKTFCCINARARDFAKIGRLILNKGNWSGNQLIPKEWIEELFQPDSTEGGSTYYKYQWWLDSSTGDILAQGILGQYLYISPSKNLLIVRLGKKEGHSNWLAILRSMAGVY